MKRKKPQPKTAAAGVETFGGTYHRFESVFEPKAEKRPLKSPKKNGRKGRPRKGSEE